MKTSLAHPPKGNGRRWSLQAMRRSVLSMAFLLLLVTPLLNYYAEITFVQGWYQSLGIGELRIISPLEGLESLLVSRQVYFPVLIGMLIPGLLAGFFGRVFCSWICPISFFGEWIAALRRRIGARKRIHDRLVFTKKLLWYSLVGELLLSLVLGAPIFVFLSPPGLVGREMMSAVYFHHLAWEGVIVLVVLLLELLTRRMYCRYFCPLGGLLALLGMQRRLRVTYHPENCSGCGRCERACPLALNPRLGEAESAYCWNCGACIHSCSEQALTFQWRSSPAAGLQGKGTQNPFDLLKKS